MGTVWGLGGRLTRLVAIVHFRTPEILLEAVDAVCSTWSWRESGDRIVVIDNGGLQADEARNLPVEVVTGHGNIGYAGAVNRAARLAADHTLVLNADVLVEPDCCDRLFAALEAEDGIVGPSLFWDRSLAVHLPPAQSTDFSGALADALSSRSPFWARIVRRRFRRVAHRHWNAQQALSSWRLSGAMLGFTRATYERVGPWDEGFRLYFEESDWLRRARRCGVVAQYLPGARAVHLYDQSPAPSVGSKGRLFEESAARFRSRHYGARTRLLEDAAGKAPTVPENEDFTRQLPEVGRTVAESHGWTEWSSRACGFPMAAGRGLLSPCPPAVASPGALHVCWVDPEGREFRLPTARNES